MEIWNAFLVELSRSHLLIKGKKFNCPICHHWMGNYHISVDKREININYCTSDNILWIEKDIIEYLPFLKEQLTAKKDSIQPTIPMSDEEAKIILEKLKIEQKVHFKKITNDMHVGMLRSMNKKGLA